MLSCQRGLEKREEIRQHDILFVLLKLKPEKVSVYRDVTDGSARESWRGELFSHAIY